MCVWDMVVGDIWCTRVSDDMPSESERDGMLGRWDVVRGRESKLDVVIERQLTVAYIPNDVIITSLLIQLTS